MGELSVNNDTVTFDWHEITSYEKACEVLNIRPIKLNKACVDCELDGELDGDNKNATL